MAVPRDYRPRLVHQSRGGNRDIFELIVESPPDDVVYIVRWRSLVFRMDRNLRITERWGREFDIGKLCDFITHLVGDTLTSLSHTCLAPEQWGHDLQPLFDREIYGYMERLEQEGRYLYLVGYTIDEFQPHPYLPPINKEASDKARALLLKNLDAEQKATFLDKNEFSVRAKDGNVYRITKKLSFNVHGPDGRKYCGQLVNTPVEDQMLAQKVLLENDPQKFFDNANISGGLL